MRWHGRYRPPGGWGSNIRAATSYFELVSLGALDTWLQHRLHMAAATHRAHMKLKSLDGTVEGTWVAGEMQVGLPTRPWPSVHIHDLLGGGGATCAAQFDVRPCWRPPVEAVALLEYVNGTEALARRKRSYTPVQSPAGDPAPPEALQAACRPTASSKPSRLHTSCADCCMGLPGIEIASRG